MILSEKLSLLRKQNGFSQEELADKLNIARQTVSKWENGLAIPELDALIGLSKLYGISLDRIVKDDDECNRALKKSPEVEQSDLVSFLIRAKQKTYAGHGAEVTSSRPASHDLRYEEGNLLYIDTFLGGEKFTGEEALWKDGIPLWSMNYSGRVTGENFSGDFLKEVLFNVPASAPYRGPAIYKNGDYSYHCKVDGSFEWFQGYEEIFYLDKKIYELYFHGGIVK
ncbi:MAG: helix-turn-helix transcriptional regulator [Treponema sp.]|nr:helix-turn-helix transcriptional regulator [Candidatus Treponema scatequi]